MIPKIKRWIRKNKRLVKLGLLIIVVLIIIIVLYKSLFYSTSEKSVYGVRLRDIKDNEFTSAERKDFKEDIANTEGIKSVNIEVKGRLIKVYVDFDDTLSNDDIKNKFNDTLRFLSENVKGYYDIEFYAKQYKDETTTYPVIGYKHKNSETISFDVF